jgi:hypothetical protein
MTVSSVALLFLPSRVLDGLACQRVVKELFLIEPDDGLPGEAGVTGDHAGDQHLERRVLPHELPLMSEPFPVGIRIGLMDFVHSEAWVRGHLLALHASGRRCRA